jgi:hypothetical protein
MNYVTQIVYKYKRPGKILPPTLALISRISALRSDFLPPLINGISTFKKSFPNNDRNNF